MYSRRQLATRALKLAIATVVVAVSQACWHVFAYLGPLNPVRPDDWWLHDLLKLGITLSALGIVPMTIAFLISVSGPSTLARQITAVVVPNVIGVLAYFALVWGSLFLVGPLFAVGVLAYAFALLPVRGLVVGLYVRLCRRRVSAEYGV